MQCFEDSPEEGRTRASLARERRRQHSFDIPLHVR